MGNIPKSVRHIGLVLLAVIVSCVWPASAEFEQYKLGVQDRLRIHVSEWPALNAEVMVGPNGDISLPVIGQIRAADLDTAELARAISRKLKEVSQLGELPDASVDIIAYRPFYILGGVTSPGEYPYRPGMMVLNALSIAGGAYRSDGFSAWDAERVAISSRGEIAVLTLRRQDLEAEKIRLTAELEGVETFPAAPSDASSQLLRALEEQRRIFDGLQERRRVAKDMLELSIVSREREIASLDQQLADVGSKRLATETELEQVRKLVVRNLAVHRLFPLERTLADILREQQELEIRKLGTGQTIADLRQELASYDETRRNEVLAEIQRVNAQMREVEEQHAALLSLLDGAAQYSSKVAEEAADSGEPQLRYMIVRSTGSEITEMEATETTRVLPGDVVKVFRVSESPITGAVSGRSGDPSPR